MPQADQSLLVKAAAELTAAAISQPKAWESLFVRKSSEEIGATLGRIFKATLQELQKPLTS